MSRNGFKDCEREYNRREEAIEMAKDQRSEAERIADSRSKSSTQSSDHPTTADDLLRECLDWGLPEDLKERIDAAMEERDAAADKYRKDNPLGGPANMFDAIASRIRSGEEYYAVLADFDVTVGALNQAESLAAAYDLLRECRAMLDGLEAQPLIYRIDAAMGEKK